MLKHDQSFLNYYFANVWVGMRPNNKFGDFLKLTGYNLARQIRPEEHVVDVGCGKNLFKGLIPKLTGIDPAFDEADYKVTIEEFKTNQQFDVAFVLGSINFGDENVIRKQIAKVLTILKPKARIYWRCHPGTSKHPFEESNNIDFFPWSFEKHEELSKDFNCKLVDLQWEHWSIDHTTLSSSGKNIFAIWKRKE